jgi:hypothetical protein
MNHAALAAHNAPPALHPKAAMVLKSVHPLYASVGAAEATTAEAPISPAMTAAVATLYVVGAVGSTAGLALGAYHGYKRHNDSVGWAIGWGLFGSAIWPLALPIAYAQGFGEAKK